MKGKTDSPWLGFTCADCGAATSEVLNYNGQDICRPCADLRDKEYITMHEIQQAIDKGICPICGKEAEILFCETCHDTPESDEINKMIEDSIPY